MKRLKAPDLIHVISSVRRDSSLGQIADTAENRKAFQEIAAAMESIPPLKDKYSEDDIRMIWVCIPRGNAEDFGNYEEMKEEELVSDREDFLSCWKETCPRDPDWFQVTIVRNKYAAVLGLNGTAVFRQIKREETSLWEADLSGFMQALTFDIMESVCRLKAGTYGEWLEKELPFCYRYGIIGRADYWKLFPDEKKEYLKGITPKDIDDLRSFLENEDRQADAANLTAGYFYRACRTAYLSAGYGERMVGWKEKKKLSDLTPKEAYLAMADGRDEGLRDIPEDSVGAFIEWKKRKQSGGHPNEVFCGGPYIGTKINPDGSGKILIWCFYAASRKEAVLSYLGIRRAGMPAVLADGENFLKSYLGLDTIHIVPLQDGISHMNGLGDEVFDEIRLGDKDTDRLIAAVRWEKASFVRP
jgi:hypothetical protein